MLLNDLFNSFFNKQQVDMNLLDFNQAFDKVSHEKVLLKTHYGIRGHTFKWIKSFLDNCVQSVTLNGTCSESIHVSSGEPHGFVLGPLLFLTYINDLPLHIN
jgi:hypothetical protein